LTFEQFLGCDLYPYFMKKRIFIQGALLWMAGCQVLWAQSYHALNGSPYAGSTSRFNNPAAPIMGAYSWEFSPLSYQISLSSNSLFLDTAAFRVRPGLMNHFVHGNTDIGILNGMFKIGSRWAISAGIRGRSYNHYKTQPINIVDTTSSLFSFLKDNRSTPNIGGYITHSGWLEGDINVSTLLLSNESGRLSVGATLQIMKGISGAYLSLRQVTYQEFTNGPDTSYIFTGGSGKFGYNYLYDQANNIQSFKDVLQQSLTSLGASIGVEYMHYNANADENIRKSPLAYNWKLGISILDIGANRYKYAGPSRNFGDPKFPISDAQIENAFMGANNLPDLVDSVSSLFNTATPVSGIFKISLPTKLVVNFDKKIYKGVYVNANVNLNLVSDESAKKWRTREINLVTLTPRWENEWFGIYLPVQLTSQGEAWLGAAVKIGPLTMGVHNFEWTKSLSKEPSLRGGGYLTLSVHPFNRKKILTNLDCWQ
jgi:hypothetical protein